MKSFSFGQKFCCFSVVALFFTLANYTLTVHRENVRLEGVIELAEMRSDVNNDFVAELLWARFNDFDYDDWSVTLSDNASNYGRN